MVRLPNRRGRSRRARSKVSLGRRREISSSLLNRHARSLVGGLLAYVALVDGGFLGTTDHLLGLGDVLAGSGAGSLECPVAVLGGEVAQLLGLGVGDVGRVIEVLVDQVLVLDVDEGSEVDDDGGEEEQTPLGSDLDEEVADEGDEEGLY